MSKEAAFLANNWILLFSALFILFATLFPTITEAINGERLTVGPPFFNRWMVPIGLMLLLLTGVGPLLAWRKSTIANLREQFMWPVADRARGRRRAGRARRARVELGHLLRAVGVCRRHADAGIHPRRQRAPRHDRHGLPHRDDRPGVAQQAALRRLHRPRRHRADLPRLCRRRLQPRRAAAAEAGRGSDGRRLHAFTSTRCA